VILDSRYVPVPMFAIDLLWPLRRHRVGPWPGRPGGWDPHAAAVGAH